MNKRSIPLILGAWLLSIPSPVLAQKKSVDYIAKAFADAGFLPHAYDEGDLIHRYGHGRTDIDQNGMIRRTYHDAASGLDVTLLSNPDVAPAFRTVDEIRVSWPATAGGAAGSVESLKGIALRGIPLGASAADVQRVTNPFAAKESAPDRIGGAVVSRTCIFHEDGSNNCYFLRDGKVVAMAVGFGP
ncbi:hypothetical protein [Stenotrophomonas sp.]|uniref:hypothetical protein n=1 Tax=Stenotrophomonas sp. TaxID=69392 RepID=UPI002FC8E330